MNTTFRQRISERRNLLILLGLICQGFIVQTYSLSIAYIFLWLLFLWLQRPQRFFPIGVEDLVVVLALVFSYKIGDSFGYNRYIFVGNGLAVFQLLRLLWPLSARDKAFSISVAIIHLGIGSQAIVDYPFILILIAAVILLPASFYDLQSEKFNVHGHGRYPQKKFLEPGMLSVLMAVFFLFFPRWNVATRSLPPGMARAGSQREQMDMAGGGMEGSEQLIFRVAGSNAEYMKSFALDMFDGRTWSASPNMFARRKEPNIPGDAPIQYRNVKVISAGTLRNILPVDGTVVSLRGPFNQEPYVAVHGGITLPYRVPPKISYAYGTLLSPVPEELSQADQKRYLNLPESQSPRLQAWLADVIGTEKQPAAVAEKIKTFLQENFTYEIGAYALNRLTPLDDFIFNQRRGHCERFASALAVLLRMRGIPARVILGFAPTEKNDIGGYYNVRAKHAHAWTEAYLPDTGWVILDATPFGTEEFSLEKKSFAFTVRDWLEYIWYGNIVEFSATEQFTLANFMSQKLSAAAGSIQKNILRLLWLGFVLILASVLYRRYQNRRKDTENSARGDENFRKAVSEAQTFYSSMLKILGKQKYFRAPQQTPLEFLRVIEAAAHPNATEVRMVTEAFCGVRYGRIPLTQEHDARVKTAIRRLNQQT